MDKLNKVLVCGSISYDTIMVFPDRFKNHILPENLQILNLAFHVPELRKEFGGCAANICYNMNLIGCNGLPVATVGNDFESYRQWLDKQGICQEFIKVIGDQCTPQDYITTDLDNNQIAAFHPGAMDLSQHNPINDFEGTLLGLISPDGLDGMRLHAKQFADANVPFIFDPGQVTPLFSGDDLLAFIEQANWAIFNSYEWQVFQEKTAYSHQDLSSNLEAHFVTRGGEGSTIYLRNETIKIPAASITQHKDPTGCGDAYRAGLVFGLLNRFDWQTTGQIASTMGAFSYESEGSQNHSFTPTEFYARYSENYGGNTLLKELLMSGK